MYNFINSQQKHDHLRKQKSKHLLFFIVRWSVVDIFSYAICDPTNAFGNTVSAQKTKGMVKKLNKTDENLQKIPVQSRTTD